MTEIPRWTVFEAALESQHDHDNPFWDITLQVRFRAPSGAEQTIDAFWDGGRAWRVRFCPDEVGEWEWASELSDPSARMTSVGNMPERFSNRCCAPWVGLGWSAIVTL